MVDIQEKLNQYIQDPFNPVYNFELACEYDYEKQYASAFSFYLRTTQYGDDTLLTYESLLRGAICFQNQTRRKLSTIGLFEYAISVCPERPEAYFKLCEYLEIEKEWKQMYLISSIGESLKNNPSLVLRTNIYFPGYYSFKFFKALSSYYMGNLNQSLKLFLELKSNKSMHSAYTTAVENNVKHLSTLNIRQDKK